jgi:arsenate reductase (thioredoxin)
MKTVIFACVHNAGRSQMAAAFLRSMTGSTEVTAISAGTAPGPHVHPVVMEAMAEIGIDLSAAVPQLLTAQLAATADYLITMGCGEACPVVPGNVLRLDWPLPDPKGQDLAAVRLIRDEIRAQVQSLINSKGWD